MGQRQNHAVSKPNDKVDCEYGTSTAIVLGVSPEFIELKYVPATARLSPPILGATNITNRRRLTMNNNNTGRQQVEEFVP